MPAPRVFISYNHNDKAFVTKLANLLKKRGSRVWLDEDMVKIGDYLVTEISKGIEEADYLLAVISNSSVKSNWVNFELRKAMTEEIQRKIIVLPLLLEDCKIPDFLEGKVYADFRQLKDQKHSLKRLLDTITPKVEIEQTPRGVVIGKRRLGIIILADGQDRVFRRKDNFFQFDGSYGYPPVLPPELEKTRKKLLAEIQSAAHKRGSPLKDNKLIRVVGLKFKKEEYDDFGVTFASNSYYYYIPFRGNLDKKLDRSKKTIRDKYFKKPQDIENCLIPSEVSVNIIVICEGEKKLIIPERGAKVAQAPSSFSESVGGAVSLDKDWDSLINCPSPFLAASRETGEELRLDISPDDVYFRRIIIGLDDPAVCFIGEVKTDLSEDEIRDRWSLATAKEYVNLHFIDFEPEAFVKFRNEHQQQGMPPICEFAFLSCLIGHFGLVRVEQALS
jgi:hypothetical protein